MDGPEFFEQLRVEVCRAEEEMASYIQRYVLMWCASYILVFHAPRSKGAHVLVVRFRVNFQTEVRMPSLDLRSFSVCKGIKKLTMNCVSSA